MPLASCELRAPIKYLRLCHDENGTAKGMDAALMISIVSEGFLLVIRPAAVRSVRTHEGNCKWSFCRVSSDEASGENA